MRRYLLIPFLLLLISGCAGPHQGLTESEPSRDLYFQEIREWQKRIQKEGWAEHHVQEILSQVVRHVEYRMEIDDHWDTPREFIRRGFRGDCEDIAVFLMGTLKRLGYPHPVKIVAVTGMFENHALLKVRMPGGGWKYFDAALEGEARLRRSYSRPIVEFDETHILYYGKPS